jgi:hypothetical protein
MRPGTAGERRGGWFVGTEAATDFYIRPFRLAAEAIRTRVASACRVRMQPLSEEWLAEHALRTAKHVDGTAW